MGPLLSDSMIDRLAWTLVHSLWQGAALACLVAGLLAWLPHKQAQLRYGVLAASLAAFIVAVAATFLALPVPTASPQDAVTITAPSSLTPSSSQMNVVTETLPAAVSANNSASKQHRNNNWPAWVVNLWLIGMVVVLARLAGGWIRAERLARCGLRPVPRFHQELAQQLARQARVLVPVQVFTSLRVQVPTVVGWLRPRILLPASTLMGLTPSQLESILLHELAHIRRFDYLINLLQAVLEAVFFYHPAIWWLSQRLRIEREHCCDDVVLKHCEVQVYARALVSLEELRNNPGPALAATDGSLIERIQRMLTPDRSSRRFPQSWIAVVTLVAILVGAGITVHAHDADKDPEAAPKAALPSAESSNPELPEPVQPPAVRPLPKPAPVASPSHFQAPPAAAPQLPEARSPFPAKEPVAPVAETSEPIFPRKTAPLPDSKPRGYQPGERDPFAPEAGPRRPGQPSSPDPYETDPKKPQPGRVLSVDGKSVVSSWQPSRQVSKQSEFFIYRGDKYLGTASLVHDVGSRVVLQRHMLAVTAPVRVGDSVDLVPAKPAPPRAVDPTHPEAAPRLPGARSMGPVAPPAPKPPVAPRATSPESSPELPTAWKIVAVDDHDPGLIVIGAGATDGIHDGDEFVVFRKNGGPIATIRAVKTTSDLAGAKVVSGDERPQLGDEVIRVKKSTKGTVPAPRPTPPRFPSTTATVESANHARIAEISGDGRFLALKTREGRFAVGQNWWIKRDNTLIARVEITVAGQRTAQAKIRLVSPDHRLELGDLAQRDRTRDPSRSQKPSNYKLRYASTLPGENVRMVAERLLGDADRYLEILDLNPGVKPDRKLRGMFLWLPPLESGSR